MALTDKALQALKPRDKNYRIADGAGLVVEVTTTGYKSFRYRYRFAGKLKMIVIGGYPDIKLAEARQKAAEARDLLDKKIDPAAAKQVEKKCKALGGAVTFESVCRQWHDKAKVRLSNATVAKHTMFMENDIFPVIGGTPIADLTPADVLRLLRRIESRGAFDIAKRSWSLVGRTMRYGVAHGLCDRDPTRDIELRDVLHPPPVKHHAAITDAKELGGLLRAIDDYSGSLQVKCALQLAPLVFVRAGELRAAEWAEFNFKKSEWRIPANRTKMKTPHIVPLAPQAIAILEKLRPLTGDGTYLFSTVPDRSRPASENTFNAALRRLGYTKEEATFHGFRSTASTFLHEQGYQHEIIERQLQHLQRNQVAAAYNYADYLPQRKAMMLEWAAFLDKVRKQK